MERELQLQHDIYNALDRLKEQLYIFEEWNRQMSKFQSENNIKIPNYTRSYIFAEYAKSHIESVSKSLDKFYISGKENIKK